MNDLLVSFAEQAAEHAVLTPSEEVLQSEVEGRKVEIPAEFISKLAELIIRECMDVANTYQNRGGNCYVDDMIAKHFGVEESTTK